MKCRVVPAALFSILVLAMALAPPVRGDEPITADEATATAGKIESSLAKGDASVFTGFVDDSAMLDIAARGMSLTPEVKAGFASGFTIGKELGDSLAAVVKQGGSYHFLHLMRVGSEHHPLFRMVGADSSVNYHELTLARAADGSIRVVDLYIYATGELMSATIHRPLLALVASDNRNVIQKLIGSDNDYVKHLAEVDAFQKATNSGDAQKALGIYDQFPDDLKQDKTMMILRIKDASSGDPAQYAAALSDLAQTFPGDPSLLLMNIDSYFLKKQYDAAYANIDQLDKRVGGDPYLDYLRASVRISQGRDADAADLCHRAASREPDLASAWEACVSETVKTGDYAKVVDGLDESAQKGGLQWTRVNTVPAFADFVKSREYADWVKTHPQDPPATQPAQ